MTVTRGQQKLLAVASGGGHWVQLLRLTPSFSAYHVIFVTVDPAYRSQAEGGGFYVVNDANRWKKWRLVKMALQLAVIFWRERPDVVISTGAAPGYVALRIGSAMRVRTVWLDSLANVDELSLSGTKIGRYADLWLTQWPHLAKPGGPHYAGSVL